MAIHKQTHGLYKIKAGGYNSVYIASAYTYDTILGCNWDIKPVVRVYCIHTSLGTGTSINTNITKFSGSMCIVKAQIYTNLAMCTNTWFTLVS